MPACYCAQTRRAARLLTQHYEAQLGKAGVSAAQFEVLTLLSAGAQHGRGIASALLLDKTTVSRNLKLLIGEGLVSAVTSKADARQLRYSLTSTGAKRLRAATAHWQRAQQTMTDRLGTETQQVTRALAALCSRAA